MSDSGRGIDRRRASGRYEARWPVAVGVTGAVLIAAGLHLLLRETYWDYSEGVYALSAHLMLHGAGLYNGLVGAQPPGVFLFGVTALAVHDGLEWLRAAVAAWQVAAGAVAALTTWRLTHRPLATAVTPIALLLTPWAVREHGALLPELVALPLLMSLPLIASSVWLGALGGVLLLIKVSFVLPFAAVVVALRGGWRAPLIAAAVYTAGLLVTALTGGVDVWRDVFYAQSETGVRSPGSVMGYWAQAAWNLAGLLVLAVQALRLRRSAHDDRLLRASVGLAAGALLTIGTTFKSGTSLNVLVPVEAALIPLAVCGSTWSLHGHRSLRSSGVMVSILAALLIAVQSLSLVARQADPRPFIRPGSARAWAAVMTRRQFAAARAAARRCPPRVPFGGPPIIAFAADRAIVGNQPDQFILAHAATFHSLDQRLRSIPSLTYC